jgi:curli biogenesis system outer membrane secretion channel CsgG
MSNLLARPGAAIVAVLLSAALAGCHKAAVEAPAGPAAGVKTSAPVIHSSTPSSGPTHDPQHSSKKKPSLEFGDEPDHILKRVRIHP